MREYQKGCVWLYSIRDRKSALWETPFASLNDETAIRDFRAFGKSPSRIYLYPDLELYCVGFCNLETGEVTGLDKPDFIEQGIDLTGSAEKEVNNVE